jgi:hypothetical protein
MRLVTAVGAAGVESATSNDVPSGPKGQHGTSFLPEWWNGIHRRLKIFCSCEHAGSSPASGTIDL